MHLRAKVLRQLVDVLLVGRCPISLCKMLVRIHLLTISLVSCWNDKSFLSTRVKVLHMRWVGNAHDRLKLVLFASRSGLLVAMYYRDPQALLVVAAHWRPLLMV